MTNEEKQLLLKDLCARLPYGVMVLVKREKYFNEIKEPYIVTLSFGTYLFDYEDITIVPYLRPLSSMTDEEKRELYNIRPYFINSDNIVIGAQCNTFIQASECQDWLNKNMFDYRGLIPMGLALEASKDMYKF